MLRTRVLTAIALLALFVGLLFYAPAPVWAGFAAAIVALAGWEWSRLCGLGSGGRLAWLAVSAAALGGAALAFWRVPATQFAEGARATFGIALAFWLFVAPVWMALRVRPAPWLAALVGWVVLLPLWAALVVLREAGPWVLLGAAAVVWVADIAAYFVGRRFGQHRLAPAISPGKTWEGVAGAVVAVIAYGVLLGVLAGADPGPLAMFTGAGAWLGLVALVVVTALSIEGDLFESWMKRLAGRKDSSSLLPGHGGVLDRIDALAPTLPFAALLVLLR